MDYNIEHISKLDRKQIFTFEFYLENGTGVMEDPYWEEKTTLRQVAVCSEFEAWITCAYKNLELHGPFAKRTSWETPNYRYRKLN